MPIPAPLPRSSPEAQGLSSRAVLAWLDALAADAAGLHSFMLLRSGTVVAEGWWAPYRPEHVHRLYSVSKSFAATAIGLLVAEGQVRLEDRVVSLFPEALPGEVGQHLAAMTVHDLLTMRTGHAEDMTGALYGTGEDDWVRAFLAQPVPYPPGTHFVYNSAASFMLSALVQRLTGEPLLEFLRPRLLEPLGVGAAHWATNPQGITLGGWGLHLTTEGVARFGQLYLQGGRWEDRQVLPESWVTEATRAQVPPGEDGASDWAQGYGYQFWRCRHGAYRADGAAGQFCIVMPRQQAVLAITAAVPDMQRVLDHVWTHLLAGMKDRALPADPAAEEALRSRCARLSLALPSLMEGWDAAPRDETYTFEPNEEGLRWARLQADAASCRLTVADGRGEHPITFGLGEWQEGRTTLWPGGEEPILARVGRQSDGTLALMVVLIEAGFHWEVAIDDGAGTLAFQVVPADFPDAKTLLAQCDRVG